LSSLLPTISTRNNRRNEQLWKVTAASKPPLKKLDKARKKAGKSSA
jgi:hypothetical protein